jgi:hypothetical protein
VSGGGVETATTHGGAAHLARCGQAVVACSVPTRRPRARQGRLQTEACPDRSPPGLQRAVVERGQAAWRARTRRTVRPRSANQRTGQALLCFFRFVHFYKKSSEIIFLLKV